MRISKVRVQGYRCIDDVTIDFDDLTALIGVGGVGKSAFHRAIEWFFDDTTLDEEDLHLPQGDDPVHADRLIVTVSFASLSAGDRAGLGRYGGSKITTFTRIGRPGEPSMLSGTALVCRDFDAIRAETDGRKRRARFADFVEARGEEFGFTKPAPSRVAEADIAMEEFERANPTRCEVEEQDASHLFGWGGGPKLRDRFDYVLVGAALEASDAMGGARNSALSRLLSGVGDLDEQTEQAVVKLQAEAEAKMESLISSARKPDLIRIGESITERVRAYVPGASVELDDVIASPGRPQPRVVARVREGAGHPADVERQGHGLQRALIIAVLQALADTEAGLQLQEGETSDPRSLMLAIEEPELYQHPLQARALAASLRSLANVPSPEKPRSLQISYSTHSPHFVHPALFENLRILRRGSDLATSQVSADSREVARIVADVGFDGDPSDKMRKTLAASLGEAVFARAVLLCEGPTDAALIEAVAGLSGGFDRVGIAVARCWGKEVIPLAFAILRQLKIPTYILFDGDAGIDARLTAKDRVSRADREAQVKATAEKNVRLLRLCGDPEEQWPERAVRKGSASFRDRLEEDLDELWPDFVQARDAVSRELGIPAKSDEAYRQAVAVASDPPEFLTQIVEKVKDLL
jgi:putative ATP-dependent endonuclease of OLD family